MLSDYCQYILTITRYWVSLLTVPITLTWLWLWGAACHAQLGRSLAPSFKGHKGHPLCPVEATMDFLAMRGPRAGQLFMHFNGNFLSRFQLNSILASALKFADPNHKNIKAHSFRIGGATNAMFKRIPYSKIQEMGRRQSHAAKKIHKTGGHRCCIPGLTGQLILPPHWCVFITTSLDIGITGEFDLGHEAPKYYFASSC